MMDSDEDDDYVDNPGILTKPFYFSNDGANNNNNNNNNNNIVPIFV